LPPPLPISLPAPNIPKRPLPCGGCILALPTPDRAIPNAVGVVVQRRVFLSYRHEDEAFAARVWALAVELRHGGWEVTFDQFVVDATAAGPDGGWPAWCRQQAREHALVLAVVSDGWTAVWDGAPATNGGFGCAAEVEVLRARAYDQHQRYGFLRGVRLAGRADRAAKELEDRGLLEVDKDVSAVLTWLEASVAPKPRHAWPAVTLRWSAVVGHDAARDAGAALLADGAAARILRVEGRSGLGKSTVAAALLAGAQASGVRAVHVNLHPGGRDREQLTLAFRRLDLGERLGDARTLLGALLRAIDHTGQPTLVVLDAFERAGPELRAWFADAVAGDVGPSARLVVVGQEVPGRDLGPLVALDLPPAEAWCAWAKENNRAWQRAGADVAGLRAQLTQRRAAVWARQDDASEVFATEVLALKTLALKSKLVQGDTPGAVAQAAIAASARHAVPTVLRAGAFLLQVTAADLDVVLGDGEGAAHLALLRDCPGFTPLNETTVSAHEAYGKSTRAHLQSREPDQLRAWCVAMVAACEATGRPADAAWYALVGGASAAELWGRRAAIEASGQAGELARLGAILGPLAGELVDGDAAAACRVVWALAEGASGLQVDLMAGRSDAEGALWVGVLRVRRALVYGHTEAAVAAAAALGALPSPVGLGWARVAVLAGERHAVLGDVLEARGDLVGALNSYNLYKTEIQKLINNLEYNSGWQRELGVAEGRRGDILLAWGDTAGALAAYESAREAMRRLVAHDAGRWDWQRELAVAESKLGVVLRIQGDLEGALHAHEAACDVFRRLTTLDPARWDWQHDFGVAASLVGDVLREREELLSAVESYGLYREIMRRLVAHDPIRTDWQRELGVAESKVGVALEERGDILGAMAAYEVYREVSGRLVKQDPGRWDWLRELGVAESRVGGVLQARGDLEGALTAFEAYRAVSRQLVAQDGRRWGWRHDLGVAESFVGDVLFARGDMTGALAAYVAARETMRWLVSQDAGRWDWLRELGVAESRVGDVLHALGDMEGALAAHHAYREVGRRLVAHDAGRWDWQHGLGVAQSRIGGTLEALGDLSGALAAFEAFREVGRRLVAHDPARWDWLRELAAAESRVGGLLEAGGNLAAALEAFASARDLMVRSVSHDAGRWGWQRDLAAAEFKVACAAGALRGGPPERDGVAAACAALERAVALAPAVESLRGELAFVRSHLR
jgi:tetratricopeptide (TPR) repeat protein